MNLPDRALRAILAASASLALIGCGAQSSASVSAEASIAPPAASETPAATATSTPAATSTGAPSPSSAPAPDPTPAPDAQRTPFLPFGQWATVTGDGLRVRAQLGVGSDIQVLATVNAGDWLFIIGPDAVSTDGYEWYMVAFGAGIGGDGYIHATGFGFVAGATSDGAEQFVALADAGCPSTPLDAATLSSLTRWTLAHCDVGSLVGLEGVLDQPIHGPITPYSHTPQWLSFPQFLTDPEEVDDAFMAVGWAVGLHFPPGLDPSTLRRGDFVRVDAHLNDPAAAGCRIIGRPDEGLPEPTEVAQQAFRLECSIAFVVDAIEITGHVDLPEP